MPRALGTAPHCGAHKARDHASAPPRSRSARSMPRALGTAPHCGAHKARDHASAPPRSRSARSMPRALGTAPHCGARRARLMLDALGFLTIAGRSRPPTRRVLVWFGPAAALIGATLGAVWWGASNV